MPDFLKLAFDTYMYHSRGLPIVLCHISMDFLTPSFDLNVPDRQTDIWTWTWTFLFMIMVAG